MKSFGEYLRDIRIKRGLSLRQLGELSGVNYAHVHRLETGQAKPTDETLEKLAKSLEAPELFVRAGRFVPPNFFKKMEKEREDEEAYKEIEEEELIKELKLDGPAPFPEGGELEEKWTGDDLFFEVFADYPNQEVQIVKTSWASIPPPLRKLLIECHYMSLSEKERLDALTVSNTAKQEDIIDTAIKLGVVKGVSEGVVKTYKTLKELISENPIWFFGCFFPGEEAYLFEGLYKAVTKLKFTKNYPFVVKLIELLSML